MKRYIRWRSVGQAGLALGLLFLVFMAFPGQAFADLLWSESNQKTTELGVGNWFHQSTVTDDAGNTYECVVVNDNKSGPEEGDKGNCGEMGGIVFNEDDRLAEKDNPDEGGTGKEKDEAEPEDPDSGEADPDQGGDDKDQAGTSKDEGKDDKDKAETDTDDGDGCEGEGCNDENKMPNPWDDDDGGYCPECGKISREIMQAAMRMGLGSTVTNKDSLESAINEAMRKGYIEGYRNGVTRVIRDVFNRKLVIREMVPADSEGGRGGAGGAGPSGPSVFEKVKGFLFGTGLKEGYTPSDTDGGSGPGGIGPEIDVVKQHEANGGEEDDKDSAKGEVKDIKDKGTGPVNPSDPTPTDLKGGQKFQMQQLKIQQQKK